MGASIVGAGGQESSEDDEVTKDSPGSGLGVDSVPWLRTDR